MLVRYVLHELGGVQFDFKFNNSRVPKNNRGGFKMSNINNFIDSTGKIKVWPSKHELKFQVLKYLSNKFEYNHFYSEKEVNNIIESYHTFNDYFLLRRGLIESKLLSRTRDGAKYWRPDDNVGGEIINELSNQ